MEGVETVVAIIRGLDDRGLAVTLMSEKRQRNWKGQKGVKAIGKSSVETSTESPKRATAAQIRDSQYASTYQMAHCRLTPTSPSPNLPEFPVQRRSPSRTKGNFKQVGKFIYEENSYSGIRDRITRGSFHYSPTSSSPTDSFVNSLRKYPLALEKSVSTELVQRLINYTQAKNSVTCRKSRSMRSLASRPPTKQKRKKAKRQANTQASKASKNTQTYTRIVNEAPLGKETKIKASNRTDEDTRCKNDQLSETYNYLKAPVSGRRSYTGFKEVRYLNDIKQCIKKTMRDIILNQAPVDCPSMQNRYEEHRRLHHKLTDSSTSPISNEVNMETSKDGSTVTENRKIDCCLGTTMSLGICPKTLSRYRIHRRCVHEELNYGPDDTVQAPTPVYCRPPLRTKCSRCFYPFGPCVSSYKDQAKELETNVDGKVFKWLKELPIFTDNSPQNQKLMLEKAQDLSDKLQDLIEEDDDDVALEEIKGFLSKLPMPPGDEEYEGPLKEDKREEIGNIISDWLKSNNFDLKTKEGERMPEEEFSENLLKQLAPLVNRNARKEELKDEIEQMLPNLLHSDVLDEIYDNVDSLVDKLHDVDVKKGGMQQKKNDKNILQDWLESIEGVPVEVKRQIRDEAINVDKILNQLVSEQAPIDVISTEINNFLDTLPDDEIPLTSQEKQELTDNLINELKATTNILNTMTPREMSLLARSLLNDLKPKIKMTVTPGQDQLTKNVTTDWLKNNPNISEETKGEIENFEERLRQLKEQGADSDVIEEELKEFLDSLQKQGVPLTSSQYNLLAKNLLNETPSQSDLVEEGIGNQTTFKPKNIKRTSESSQSTLGLSEGTPNVPQKEKNKSRNLEQKLHQLKNQGADSDVIEKEGLVNSLKRQEAPPNSSQNNELSKNLLSPDSVQKSRQKRDLTNQTTSKPKNIKRASRSSQSSTDRFEGDPNISQKVKNKTRNFEEKLRQSKDQNYNSDVIEEMKQLVDSPRKQGGPLSSSQYNQSGKNRLSRSPVQENRLKSQSKDQNADSDEIEKVKQFVDSPRKQGGPLSSSQYDQLAKNRLSHSPVQEYRLKKDLGSQTSFKPNIKRETGSSQSATGLLEGISNVPQKVKDKIGNFEERLRQLKDQGADSDVIEEEMKKFVDSLKKQGVPLSLSQYNQLTKNLLSQTPVQENQLKRDSGNQTFKSKNLKRASRSSQQTIDWSEGVSSIPQKIAAFKSSESMPEDLFLSSQATKIKGALLDWLKKQEFYEDTSSNEKRIQENIFDNLGDRLYSIIDETSPQDDNELAVLEEIKKHLQEIPMDVELKSDQNYMDELANDILGNLKELNLLQKMSLIDDTPAGLANRKAADILLDDIAKWVENLPMESVTPEDKVQMDKIKQQLEAKLLHKIGELNMNPEVFSDDFLYEDMLGDEVDNLLSNIPSENVKKKHKKLKKELLGIIRKARKNFQEENAGQIYKQKLRETIVELLPPFDLNADGQALFEVLKDNIADAFISMHYVSNDEAEINKLKDKIGDEIYKFCHDYLKRCPAVPLDISRLNANLYNALENIAEPENEAFRNDVEVIKIKDEIVDWVKELPLKSQTGQDKLQTNKIISVLAKKLHEIENMRVISGNNEENTKREITKFLKKLSLSIDDEDDDDINEFSEILEKKLRDTEMLRKSKASSRHSVQYNSIATLPPCTLNQEDKDHLERIRKRTPKIRQKVLIDESLSPCPVNASSQTEIKCPSFGICPVRNRCVTQRDSSVQTNKRMQAAASQINESPNIRVLEPSQSPNQYCHPHPSCANITQNFSRPQRSEGSCVIDVPNLPPMQYINPQSSKTSPCTQHQIHEPYSRPEYQQNRPVQCRLGDSFHGQANQHAMHHQTPNSCPRSQTQRWQQGMALQDQSSSTQSSMFYKPPQQVPLAPCQQPSQMPLPRISSGEYGPRPSCSFQKRVTHLGSFDHNSHICMPPHREWNNTQHKAGSHNCHNWTKNRNRQCMPSDNEEGKRCRCKPKCGRQSGRRHPFHVHNDATMSSCLKCCGVHCPYPCYLFFK